PENSFRRSLKAKRRNRPETKAMVSALLRWITASSACVPRSRALARVSKDGRERACGQPWRLAARAASASGRRRCVWMPSRHERRCQKREGQFTALVGAGVARLDDAPFGARRRESLRGDLAGIAQRITGQHRLDPAQLAKA